MESITTPVYYVRRKEDEFFRKRYTATTAFAIGILLFFLPFAELRCGSITLIGNTGIGIATGGEWKMALGGKTMMDRFASEGSSKTLKNPMSTKPELFMLFALVTAIFGLCTVFFNQQWKHLAGMCAGILACLLFIAVIIKFNTTINGALRGSSNDKDSSMEGMQRLIRIRFTIWFYLSFAAFAVAAFFCFKHYRLEMEDAIARTVDFEFQKHEE